MGSKVDEALRARIWDCARKADTAGIADLFRAMREPERAALRPITKELQAELARHQRSNSGSLHDPEGRRLPVTSYQFEFVCNGCIVATEGKSILLRLLGWQFGRDEAVLTRILADRNPPWLQEFIEEAFDRPTGDLGNWFDLARALLARGLIKKPSLQGYTLGMIAALSRWEIQDHADSLASYMLLSSDLLDEVWRLFEVEGGGETSLANSDKFGKGGDVFRWSVALRQLSEQGHLDRQRLLDESLKALARDFSQYRAGWHSRFHEFMQPTVAERVQRVGAYCGLLASNVSPTVSFALKALRAVQRAKFLEPLPFLDAVGRALRAEYKGTVLLALRMLEGLAKDGSTRTAALSAALPALHHGAGEVQAATLKLIRKYGAPEGVRLVDHAGHLAPSVAQEFADVLGGPPPTEESALDEPALIAAAKALPELWAERAGVSGVLHSIKRGDAVSALELDPSLTPRLNPATRLEPIKDLDELIECAAHVIEQPDTPDEIERMIDGACRLCDQRPDDFADRTAQLAKRAHHFATRNREVVRDLAEVNVLRTVAHFVQDWLGHRRSTSIPTGRYWDTIYLPRLNALSGRLKQGRPFQPLSTPTHSGGWLDPQTLVERLKAASDVLRDDLILALVRLAPDGRAEALANLPGLQDESCCAVRYALGGAMSATPRTDFGLWHAAATARNFGCGDEALATHFGALGNFFRRPDLPWHVKARKYDTHTFYEFGIRVDWGPSDADDTKHITTTLRGAMPKANAWGWHVTVEAARWVATHLPGDLKLYFGGAAYLLAHNIDWWGAEWGNKHLLEPLLDPDRPMTPMATVCLTLALAAKQAGEHGLATDILIAAIEDGRMDGRKLGESMGALLFTSKIKPPRWAKTLAEAARASALHTHVVRLAIENALGAAGDKKPPRGLKDLLELWYELAIAAGAAVTNDAARTFLGRIQGSSGQGKVAKALLGIEPSPDRDPTKQAAVLALAARIARAQRWAGYGT